MVVVVKVLALTLVEVSVFVTRGPGLMRFSNARFSLCRVTYIVIVVVVVDGEPVVCGIVSVFDGTEAMVETVIVLVFAE